MKRTAIILALLLSLMLCGCGNVEDAKPTASPVPTIQVLPEATAQVSPAASAKPRVRRGPEMRYL